MICIIRKGRGRWLWTVVDLGFLLSGYTFKVDQMVIKASNVLLSGFHLFKGAFKFFGCFEKFLIFFC